MPREAGIRRCGMPRQGIMSDPVQAAAVFTVLVLFVIKKISFAVFSAALEIFLRKKRYRMATIIIARESRGKLSWKSGSVAFESLILCD